MSFCYKLWVSVPGRPFLPNLMFVGRVRRLPLSRAPKMCFTRVSF